MNDSTTGTGGLRERKRRQTRLRVVDSGLRLFLANGYEATTLDAIAGAADISRRTYFSYFASKDELLLAWQEGADDAMRAALIELAPDRAPFDAVRGALSKVVSLFETADFIAIDDLMQSTEGLRACKQAGYERQERALFAALCEIWPEQDRRAALHMLAMVATGALRLALERWREDDRKGPVAEYLDAAFDTLQQEV